MWCRVVVVLSALILASASCAARAPLTSVRFAGLAAPTDRPFRLDHQVRVFRLDNGLTVALLPDDRTNLVKVDVRYAVGSAEDPAGLGGLAHLVEHLTFEARLEAGGATLGDQLGELALVHNARTDEEETDYDATALADQLDGILEVEAWRLALTCDQLDDATFLRERDVVLAEHAMRASPRARMWREMSVAVWGADHPYARAVSTTEIATATRQDACAFIAAHYRPERAILVVDGNFDADAVATRITARFGAIAGDAAAPRAEVAAPGFDGETSTHRADLGNGAIVAVYFPSGPWGGPDAVLSQLAARFLARALDLADVEHAWILDSGVAVSGGKRARATVAYVVLAHHGRRAAAAELIFETAAHLFDDVPAAELERARAELRTSYAASYDRFASRADWIADLLLHADDRLMTPELEALDRVTVDRLAAYAEATYARARSHVSEVHSGPGADDEHDAATGSGTAHDLDPWRVQVDADEATRPIATRPRRIARAVDSFELDNGLTVLLAPDPASPVVEARLQFPVGSGIDDPDRPGVAELAAEVLDHDLGARYRSRDRALLDQVMALGTRMSTEVGESTTTFRSQGLASHAGWQLWRLFWLLDAGRYDPDAMRIVHRRSDGRYDTGDESLAHLLLRQKLFGADHLYARVGLSINVRRRIKVDDLQAFRALHYRARGATLIVTGGFDAPAIKAEIEQLFGSWDGAAPPPPDLPVAPQPAAGPSWLAERRGPGRADVELAFLAGSIRRRDLAARLVLQEMLRDRVRVVREGMGASYAVAVGYTGGTSASALHIEAQLDPAQAGPALRAILDAVATMRDDTGRFAADLVRARRRVLARVLADMAGAASAADELEIIAARGLPLDYFDQLAAQVAATTLAEIEAVARRDLRDDRMVALISGPGTSVDAMLEAANIDRRAVTSFGDE